jgi:cytochrome c oxidase subunit II
MKVDLYERIWMVGVSIMLAIMFTTMAFAATRFSETPPSHVETIDPSAVMQDVRFRKEGVSLDSAGHVHVVVVGTTFTWLPATMTLPAATPVTFHVTSLDVIHGFEIVRTNGQSMIIPGYISQFTTEFAPGEYMIVCNEYCGVGHHLMFTKMTVVPAAQWTRPTTTYAGPSMIPAGGAHGQH